MAQVTDLRKPGDISVSKKKSDKTLFIILTLFILALGGVGYYFVLQFKSDINKRLEAAEKSSQANYQQVEKNVQPITDDYVIYELGVKFIPTDTLKTDIITTHFRYDAADKADIVYLSTVKWVKLDKECSPSTSGSGGVIALSKYTGVFDANNANPGEELVKQFDGFYVTSGGAQAFCSQNQTVKNEWNAIMTEFNNSFKTLTEV